MIDGLQPRFARVVELLTAAEADLLAEQDDEWSVGRRYFGVESMALIGAPQREEVLPAAVDRELIRCRREDPPPAAPVTPLDGT